jgi:hypothetical protein
VFGMVLSIVAGVLYGFNMVPVQYLGKTITPQPEPIHFAFSHFAGIFLMSTFILIIVSTAVNNAVHNESLLQLRYDETETFHGSKFYQIYF